MDLIPDEVLTKIFLHLDEDSKLLIGLVCKYYYFLLKKNNNKLKCSLKYLNSSYSLSEYCHKYNKKDLKCFHRTNYLFKKHDISETPYILPINHCLFCLSYSLSILYFWHNKINEFDILFCYEDAATSAFYNQCWKGKYDKLKYDKFPEEELKIIKYLSNNSYYFQKRQTLHYLLSICE